MYVPYITGICAGGSHNVFGPIFLSFSGKYPQYSNWLVVSTPLKNINQLGWLFSIYRKNVPNHQPGNIDMEHHPFK